MTFGQKLKAIRKRDNVTQQSLAAHLHMDTAYLSRIENDKRDHLPSVGMIERIVSGFDLTQEDADSLFIAAKKLPPDITAKLLSDPCLLDLVRKTKTSASKKVVRS